MFSPKETDQAFIGGSSPRVQESASCIADDDGSAQWDNFQVIEGGIAFLFIQEPGADNRALMIGSWLQVTSAEHSGMFHSLIKNKKLMGAVSHLFKH